MRILHTMLRVGDLDLSLQFYTEVLGMQVLRRRDYPEGKFTLAFVGYGPESQETVLELTHNWETKHYDLGNGYGHIALEVEDAYKACEEVKRRGVKDFAIIENIRGRYVSLGVFSSRDNAQARLDELAEKGVDSARIDSRVVATAGRTILQIRDIDADLQAQLNTRGLLQSSYGWVKCKT